MSVEADDNLIIDLHLQTFPLSIRGLMSTFPLGERKELQSLCFMMPTRIIYVSSENRKHETMSLGRIFSLTSAFFYALVLMLGRHLNKQVICQLNDLCFQFLLAHWNLLIFFFQMLRLMLTSIAMMTNSSRVVEWKTFFAE